ncbi:cysteine desulfurase family protein [Staphylospora marina]|uniref:cysteine desulfurase family protein n=1 Tax=Staphylospora marina TaxID=2490858 RepID=UPI001F1533BA|nr:cysteine desulfurase family protein [Staphylospora marina]
MIYLDNSATTRTHPEVVSVMADVMHNVFGNPSSLHGIGAKSQRLLEQARKRIAGTLSCSPGEIFFTSGGTEANNLAILGTAERWRERGRHVITTMVEHPSVFEAVRRLESKGWKVTWLPVDSTGRVSPDEVEKAITDETVLVSVMHVNNETGAIQPVSEIGRRLERFPRVIFHVDAVQSFGKIPLIPAECRIDLLSASGHKLHGPKGTGFLYIRKGLEIFPIVHGGDQERGIRSGTENVPGIAGLAKAVALAEGKREAFLEQTRRWKREFLRKVTNHLPDVVVNGDPEQDAPYIISLSFPGLKSEVIVHALEREGVYVSSKSACSSKKETPSRILKAMGRTDEEALGGIRISMGLETSEDDLTRAADALIRVIPPLTQVMKVRKQ